MTPGAEYLSKCRELIAVVEKQQASIQQAADWFAEHLAVTEHPPTLYDLGQEESGYET